MKTNPGKAVETFYELIDERGDAPPNIEDLPPDRQEWYKA